MNGKSGAPTALASLFIPSLNLKGLLYSKYGCGLTYISYILLVLALSDKQLRKLSIVTLASFYSPLMWFIMNGFLYARSKDHDCLYSNRGLYHVYDVSKD